MRVPVINLIRINLRTNIVESLIIGSRDFAVGYFVGMHLVSTDWSIGRRRGVESSVFFVFLRAMFAEEDHCYAECDGEEEDAAHDDAD